MLEKKSKPKPPATFWEHVGHGFHQVWRYLFTGLLIWVPLIITIWVSWLVVDKVILGLERLIKAVLTGLQTASGRIPPLEFFNLIHYRVGMGVLLAVALFLTTGYLTRYLVGRKLIEYGERLVRVIPFFNRIYQAVVQIRDVFVSREGAVFQGVCLIEYPRPGVTAVAFITSDQQGVIQTIKGRELVAVFMPTTPNPTSGFLMYLPREDITPLNIEVEEAMKLIISGGAYMPEEARDEGHSDEAEDASPEV